MAGRSFVFALDRHNVLQRVAVRILAHSPRLPWEAVSGSLRLHEPVVLMPMGLKPGERVSPHTPDPSAGMGAAGRGGTR